MPSKPEQIVIRILLGTIAIFLLWSGLVHLRSAAPFFSDSLLPQAFISLILGVLTGGLSYRKLQKRLQAEQDKEAQIEQLQKELAEKQQSEQALRLSEERFRLAMAGANDGLFDSNELTGELYYSPRWKKMLGYEEHEIGNRLEEWKDRLHPEDEERVVQQTEEFISGDLDRFEAEFRLRHKEGHYLNIISRAFALKDEQGRIVRTVGTHRDISDLRQAEKTMRESERKYRLIFENIQVVYIEASIDNTILEVSPFVERVFQYTRRQLIGSSTSILWKDPDQHKAYLERLKRSGRIEDFEAAFLDKQGHTVFGSVFSTVEADEEGIQYKIISSVLDITRRKQSENALKESEIRYKNLCENMQAGVVIIRPVNNGEDFVVVDFNKGAEQIEQKERKEVLGKSISETFPGVVKYGLFDVLKQVFQTGISQSYPVSFHHNESLAGWHENYVYKLPSGEMVIVYEDKTKQKRAEDALKTAHDQLEKEVEKRTRELQETNTRLAQEIRFRRETEHKLLFAKHLAEAANKAKSEFLSNISHELRNPMHQILSYSKYGINKFDSAGEEKLYHYFNQIRQSADRLMYLLNDLLDLSKMEAGRMEYHFEDNDLREILAEVTAEFKTSLKEKQLRLIVDSPDTPQLVNCDALRMGQVVRNLLSNAIKYSHKNGHIRIACIQNQHPDIFDGSDHLQVSVTDQGVGIPEDELELVFDKFTQSSKTQTGAGGTGLGLAICKEIILTHNGTIWAEQNPQGGSIFKFLLPISFTS